MNKSSVYIVIIVLLVVCNGIFGFMLFTKPGPPHGGHPPHQKPKEIIAEKLQLSDDQIAKYDVLIEQHQADISNQEEEIKALKHELFGLLAKDLDAPLEEVEMIAFQIATKQKNIELIHFHHFSDIKGLCNSDQKKSFNALAQELGKIFAPHHPLHPPKK